jgi:hypothetical protein
MSDKDIARLNVEHFHRLLATDVDDAKRHTILQLLAKEKTKLAPLNDRLSRFPKPPVGRTHVDPSPGF